jgi:hypothetical protein
VVACGSGGALAAKCKVPDNLDVLCQRDNTHQKLVHDIDDRYVAQCMGTLVMHGEPTNERALVERNFVWRDEEAGIETLLRRQRPTGWRMHPHDVMGRAYEVTGNVLAEPERILVIHTSATWPLVIRAHGKPATYELLHAVGSEHSNVFMYGAFDLDDDGDVEIAFGVPGQDEEGIISWETLTVVELGSKQRFDGYTKVP